MIRIFNLIGWWGNLRIVYILCRTTLVLLSLLSHDIVCGQQPLWVAQAPGPNTQGQVENIKDGEVSGAIKTVALHPTDANIAYVGAVNGGIWKTTSAMAPNPNWIPQTDNLGSLSIGDIQLDPTIANHQTLVAGIGRFSSYVSAGGGFIGLLRTTDGGNNWVKINDNGALNGFNITGVAPRNAVIIISVDRVDDNFNSSKIGIWRSMDTGKTWTQISGGNGTGLPPGESAGLASDPTNPNILYTDAGVSGIYRSNDVGANWFKVSSDEINALITGSNNIKIAVGRNNNVYVGVVKLGRLAGVFRSGNGGITWSEMDVPMSDEDGIHPGGQGTLHFSLTADSSDPNIVYAGGDRQSGGFLIDHSVSNSIGAKDYSGNIVRGDASKPRGNQWVHITHSNSIGPAGGGTASSSSPHADSRDMAIATNGMLVEVDDGGIYRQTNPLTNTGDWFSMNGNIQVTEFHSIAWDSNSHIAVGGAQDTGSSAQEKKANVRWKSVVTGDGGVVAVDDKSTPGHSIRYFYSGWNGLTALYDFRREVYDQNGFISMVKPTQSVISGKLLETQFYTPIKLNTVKPSRLIIGAANGVYESFNQGDQLITIKSGVAVNSIIYDNNGNVRATADNPIAYGAVGNADMLYVGSEDIVYIRAAAHPAPLKPSLTYAGGLVLSISIDPNKPKTAYVVGENGIYQTVDAGNSWSNITGNLMSFAPGKLRSLAYCTHINEGAIVVGTDMGLFMAEGPEFSNWAKLNQGFPNAPVMSLEYDPADRILVAGTLGRGAWTLSFPGSPPPPIAVSGIAPPLSNIEQPTAIPTASGTTLSQSPINANSFQLTSGVIIDPAKNQAYIMTPVGSVDAINLSDKGSKAWSNNDTAKPLAIISGNLITQANTPDGADNKLKIVTLDPTTGKSNKDAIVSLPPSVKASVLETDNSFFSTTPKPVNTNPNTKEVDVSWQFISVPNNKLPEKGLIRGTKGMRSDKANNNSSTGNLNASKIQSGSFRLNLTTGQTSNIIIKDSMLVVAPIPQSRPQPSVLSNTGGTNTKYLSADGKHLLTSQKTNDDLVWDKYTITVTARATGARIGEFKSHVPVVPFYVKNSIIYYITEPYSRRVNNGLLEEPLKLRALNLTTGKELWSQAVKDTNYSRAP